MDTLLAMAIDLATQLQADPRCEAVKAAGQEPMVYFNGYQARNLMDMEQLECYSWWLAMYDVGEEFPCRMDIWQYSCTGSVPGIEGNVDLNLMFPAEKE